jgi:hypothetical protein
MTRTYRPNRPLSWSCLKSAVEILSPSFSGAFGTAGIACAAWPLAHALRRAPARASSVDILAVELGRWLRNPENTLSRSLQWACRLLHLIVGGAKGQWVRFSPPGYRAINVIETRGRVS